MRLGRSHSIILLITAYAASGSVAYAQRLDDRVWLQAGAFRPSFDSDARVDIPDTPIDGTDIDFETDLDLPDHKTVVNVEGGVRITDHLRLEGGYFSLKRAAEVTLEQDIRWEETTYPATAVVDSAFRSDIYRAALGYSFVKSKDFEVGARIGAHITKFKMFIEGDGIVDGLLVAVKREQKDKSVPMPNLGLYANADLSKTFSLSGGANWFKLKVGDYKGSILDLSAGISARIVRNLGIGARYRYVDYGLRARASDWDGKVNYRFHGPAVFLEVAF